MNHSRSGEQFLGSLNGVDAFILKSRCPSCGTGNVKVFDEMDSKAAVRRAPGIFAGRVLNRYGHLAVEDEGCLRRRSPA